MAVMWDGEGEGEGGELRCLLMRDRRGVERAASVDIVARRWPGGAGQGRFFFCLFV